MPERSFAITLFSLSKPLIKVDFPTLGLPTIESYIGFFFMGLSEVRFLDDLYTPACVRVSKGLMSLSESKSELSSGLGFRLSNSLSH